MLRIFRTYAAFVIMVVGVFYRPGISANAQEYEGDYLYHVSTVRADVGKLSDLPDLLAEMKASNYFDEAGMRAPLLMRHSQGDQWDLMSITPMKSWVDFHSKKKTSRRDRAAEKYADDLAKGAALIAFAEDHFAYGPPLEVIETAYNQNAFYHIEMFSAAAGKANELFEQRRMENAYLSATGQTQNMIFRRAGGSDVDVFTIGFHENLQAFAEPSGATPEEAEAAAKAVGFEGRADISFYLRSLISSHHDTLSVKVE